MKQILHIFRKDTKHFWPEILTSLVVTAIFAYVYPRQWVPLQDLNRELSNVANALSVLVPLSWWILIGRVVQDESLVGENQFWLTRPYDRKMLLGAKALFVVVWVYLPFLLAQSLLLEAGGFHPASFVPGLAFSLLLVSVILVAPLFALSTVTRNFPRLTLTLVGVLAAIVGIAYLASQAGGSSVSVPNSGNASLPLMLAGCGAVIIIQYAVRRVWLARGLLVAFPILIGAVAFALTGGDERAVDRAYSRASGAFTPLRIAFAPDALNTVHSDPANPGDKIRVQIPVEVSDVPDGDVVQVDNVKFSVTPPDGAQWDSPWQGIYGQRYFPGVQTISVPVVLSPAIFNQFKSKSVTLHLTLALTQIRAGSVSRAPMSAHDVSIPGFGICSTDQFGFAFARNLGSAIGLQCRSPLHQPQLTRITVESSEANCPLSQLGKYERPETWEGSLDPDPADFGITSVWMIRPYLWSRSGNGNRFDGKQVASCRNSSFEFTPYRVVSRTLMDLTIPNFHLPPNEPL